jgi:hypothetical protein
MEKVALWALELYHSSNTHSTKRCDKLLYFGWFALNPNLHVYFWNFSYIILCAWQFSTLALVIDDLHMMLKIPSITFTACDWVWSLLLRNCQKPMKLKVYHILTSCTSNSWRIKPNTLDFDIFCWLI